MLFVGVSGASVYHTHMLRLILEDAPACPAALLRTTAGQAGTLESVLC